MGRFNAKMSDRAERAFSNFSGGGIFGDEISRDFKDWKAPENRLELFFRYFKWRVTTHDLDHTHYLSVLSEGYDYEQKAWLAMFFGMTYRTPQAFAYSESFPDAHNVSIEEVEKWHTENWKRTTYGTDARYNKGHFVKQFVSVRNWLNGKSFKEKFDSILIHDTQRENFWALYSEILTLYKYGRMTGWLAMQGLYDLLKLPIDPEDIMIEGFTPNNDSSLKSIWNGLCALRDEPHKMVGGTYGDYICQEEDIVFGREALLDYTSQAEQFAGFKIDSFRKESIWCQYKRLFNEEGSREYPGHASGDATSRYLYYRENWKDIDWSKFRKALRLQPGWVKGLTFIDWMNTSFGRTGLMVNMSEMFDDMPNAWELLDVSPEEFIVKEIWEDDNLAVPSVSKFKSSFQEDIKTCPRYFDEL